MDGSDRMISDQTTQAGQLQRVATPRSSGPSIISMGGRRPSQHSHLSQQIVEELQQKFRFQDEQLAELSQHQLIMEETANKLATNLTTALEQLANSQGRSEAITKLHAEAIQSAQHQNTAIKDQNQQVEDVTKAHRTLIEMQLKDREGMIQQIKNLFQEQSVRLGAQESENVIMKERLLLMREENKQRRRLDTETPKIGLAHRSPVKKEEGSQSSSTVPSFGPKEPCNPYAEMFSQSQQDTGNPPHEGKGYGMTPPRGLESPINAQSYHGLALSNVMIDDCPAFTPQGYQQWRREVKLWLGAQAGATATQLLSKLIMKLPLAIKMDAMTYMEETELNPQSRNMQRIFDLLDERYGKPILENHGCGYHSLQNSNAM